MLELLLSLIHLNMSYCVYIHVNKNNPTVDVRRVNMLQILLIHRDYMMYELKIELFSDFVAYFDVWDIGIW